MQWKPSQEAEGLSEQGIDACGRITLMVNLPVEYSDKPVTPFGGMALMKRFVDQTGIGEHLATGSASRWVESSV
jgi:hypothetical protein